ncbi:uncharacterized protein LOC105253809 [Camponotus floridanus]|uniref:uncharacterized protein LOC105253809 n=1 Tax=Camponotus floridanus TaxID=104421 RepID=UPI00059C16D9|nr:uncharacterized protein LOC105253809 [Camponotus floridanus]
MIAVNKISIVYLVTRVCLTSAILAAKTSSDPTNVSRPWHSYLLATTTLFPKHPNHQYDDGSIGADVEKFVSSGEHPIGIQSAISTLNNRRQKSQVGPQRFPTEIHQDDFLAKVPNASPSPLLTSTTTMTTLSESGDIREYQRHAPRRFAHLDIEAPDRYLTDEPDDDKLPYREKAELSTYYRRDPQDITAAIKTLDRFLSRTLNDDSYNSKLHPPLNPVLALILSRYGRYVPGTRNPRVYAYMAVNNIHNNLPFGRYKYEHDEEPIYAR